MRPVLCAGVKTSAGLGQGEPSAARTTRDQLEPEAPSAPSPAPARADIVDDVADMDYLMEHMLPKIRDYRLGIADPENAQVVEFLTPQELLKELEGLDEGLPEHGTDLDSIIKCLDKALRYSVRTGHPRYFDKLCHGSESVGQVGVLRCGL